MDKNDKDANEYGPFSKANFREWLNNLRENDKEFRNFAMMLVWKKSEPQMRKIYLMQALDVPQEVQNAIFMGKEIPNVELFPAGPPSGPAEDNTALEEELRDAVVRVVRETLQDSAQFKAGELDRQRFIDIAKASVESIMVKELEGGQAVRDLKEIGMQAFMTQAKQRMIAGRAQEYLDAYFSSR